MRLSGLAPHVSERRKDRKSWNWVFLAALTTAACVAFSLKRYRLTHERPTKTHKLETSEVPSLDAHDTPLPFSLCFLPVFLP
jgi:hypothetical protein